MKKIAVVLTGCGYLDGSEIRESVLTLLALDALNLPYDIFALNEDQFHTVNHLTGTVQPQTRNILEESARIARGKILDLKDLEVDHYSSIIIPGGFGVAKNLCKFAIDGVNAEVNAVVLKTINDFYENNKPIGAVCISPALIALSLGKHHPTITLGSNDELAKEIEKTGVLHRNCKTSECIIDEKNKIVTTPAYMDDDINLNDAFSGISKLVKAIVELS